MNNSIIKIDLHIHSKASAYKEDSGIVASSDIEHLDTLLNKLEENKVSMFSITDHNRFDSALYQEIDHKIQNSQYNYVKQILAGVEFDVKFDEEMSKCHIITLFDANNIKENYDRIQDEIENDKIIDKDEYYSRKDFEDLLKRIGLDVILIACQRNGLDMATTKHNSFSDSTKDPVEFLSIGYITALEFQKPNVEGILKENLKNLPSNISLVTGSDCHDWSCYPYHDKNNQNLNFSHTKIKALPTFKGLLLALTAPKNRINCQKNTNDYYIEKINIKGEDIPLVNGINVIIGENGSGKSTILNKLSGGKTKSYEDKILQKNSISVNPVNLEKVYLVRQGEIVKKFSDNTLFPDDNYVQVDLSEFGNTYKDFKEKLFTCIRDNIKAKETRDSLDGEILQYDDIFGKENYYVSVVVDSDFCDVTNQHKEPLDKVQKILKETKKIKGDKYFSIYSEKISSIVNTFEEIEEDINDNYYQKETEIFAREEISRLCEEYNSKVRKASTSIDNQLRDYKITRDIFADKIILAAKVNGEKRDFPKTPEPIPGRSSNLKNGFYFNCETRFNDQDMSEEFLSHMFNKNFGTLESLKMINTKEQLVEAIRGCSAEKDIQEKINNNFKSFLDDGDTVNKYIKDDNNAGVGNTLGELSLAFFNYQTQNNNKASVFLFDQPEDNISNKNIASKLIDYLDLIRYRSQIIIVTHNPLLVVNQDADQVIFLKKDDDLITVCSGCLEYQNEKWSMLDLIADNMDGGRKSIERRLKVYGKNNNNDD